MSTSVKLSPSQVIQDLLKTPEVAESFRIFEQQADAIARRADQNMLGSFQPFW